MGFALAAVAGACSNKKVRAIRESVLWAGELFHKRAPECLSATTTTTTTANKFAFKNRIRGRTTLKALANMQSKQEVTRQTPVVQRPRYGKSTTFSLAIPAIFHFTFRAQSLSFPAASIAWDESSVWKGMARETSAGILSRLSTCRLSISPLVCAHGRQLLQPPLQQRAAMCGAKGQKKCWYALHTSVSNEQRRFQSIHVAIAGCANGEK